MSTVQQEYLRVDDVAKVYPSGGGVAGTTIALQQGEMLVLLGPSGCGKTTLLRILAGLLRPDQGAVHLDGRDITRVPTHKRNISMVFQTWALFPTMTVADNVAFGLRMRGMPARERAEAVRRALELVNLAGYGERRPKELSGGQQQRVALARAVVTNPAVLLLDEPLSSLDHRIRVQLRGQLKHLQRDLGLTGVYVTHDHTEALALGDRIAVMSAGRIVEVGDPVGVFSRPRHRYTAEFLDLANVIDVTIDGDGLRTPFGNVVRPEGSSGGVVAVAVRPDEIALTANDSTVDAPVGAAQDGLRGQVTMVEYQPGGILQEVSIDGGGSLKVFSGVGQGHPLGARVAVRVDWSKAVPLVE
jgi:ABC-type Fe3+/spermidine/putrescine transport system ATPase subunit